MESPPKIVVLGALALVALAAACGRTATEADCQLIVDRNVELQMKAMNLTDPDAIGKKQAEFKSDPEMKAQLEACVGRRVTDGMMKCVRSAVTADEISQCMR